MIIARQYDIFGELSQIYIEKNGKEIILNVEKEGLNDELYSDTKRPTRTRQTIENS